MNSWHQRHSVYLKQFANKQTQNIGLASDQRDVKNHFKKYLGQGLGAISLFGLCVAIVAIVEPMISGSRLSASAETCVKPSNLQNFLNKVSLGEDNLTRYASAANAIENKRLELFREAKSNPDWSNVANLAESKQTKVCDLTNPPEFLRSLCNQLRTYSEEEICRNGFTTKEFNQITLEQKQNPRLRSIIQGKQIQLRGNK
ncbi:hypothetical protein APA_1513 [Pseudanabaena sp. lw0831]|uniref:DUF4168 domain-containing protein n=1 Tax=Pseudanabaena sp. lw0831 TaxID=1357935 RepID=UPI0019163F4F|nr:DUF4168 domain-containing protein [Pseudanabaena sp. lw0831]GBO53606.1 hypothetical protein APA_1513 [Pseudanabaena sp. lw0831]